jgi:hypothetical protein
MQRSRRLLAGVLLSLLAATAAADDLPSIRAGLWEIRSGSEQAAAGAVRQCIDDATFREMLQAAQRMMGNACSPLAVRRGKDQYIADVRCQLGPSTLASSTELTGDFQTVYRSVTRTSIVPPLLGQGGSVEVSTGRFLGACSAGMRPGDAILPDGRRVNVPATMRQIPDLGALSAITGLLNGVPPARRN